MTTPVRTPSFFDLRKFAESSRQSADDKALIRRHLQLPAGPVSVGALHVAPGEHTETIDADEFVIASAGTLTLRSDGKECLLADGDSAVIRSGSAVTWKAEAPATLIFMRYRAAAGQETGVVPIDTTAELAPSGAPLAELLTTPTPACRNYTDYRSADGEFVCGTWDSTPYTRTAMRYRHYELMYFLDGEVAFEDETGAQATYAQGDIFLIRQDAECSWDSQVYVRKVYAIWRPA